jgi:uncharacterized glyoxalase superfamily protein PhnB
VLRTDNPEQTPMMVARDNPPVAPYLTVDGAAQAIEFYKTVFGAIERRRMLTRDLGKVLHAELSINGGIVMLHDDGVEPVESVCAPNGHTTVSLSLGMEDTDAVDRCFARALANGSKPEMAPTDAFWGTRFASFRDPFGHRWMLNAARR